MRSTRLAGLAFLFGMALWADAGGGWAEETAHVCKTCGQHTYGTSVEWEASPTDAATKAKKEEKLVFALHVSGHFEDPGVT